MEKDLYELFDIGEGQHFWIKYKNNIIEVFIKNGELMVYDRGGSEAGIYPCNISINELSNIEVYTKEPANLNENTKSFLKLINKKYKYITRNGFGDLQIFEKKPRKNEDDMRWNSFNELNYNYIHDSWFDIDLSYIKWEDESPTLISDLLEGKYQ